MMSLSSAVRTLLFAIFLFACQKQINKDLVVDPDVTAGSYTGKKVQASFQGQVLTETGEAVTGALVTVGTATTSTDRYGVFSLIGVQTDDQFGYVKVEKQGYLVGSRTVLTRRGVH